MNLDSNIATNLFSNDLSGMAAAGTQHGVSCGESGGSVGSLFQRMITQMITGRAQTEAAADGTGGQTPEGSEGIGQALSELISGGTLASIRNLNIGGELTEGKEKFEERKSLDENSEAIEAVRALMGDLTNAVRASDLVRVLQENRVGKYSTGQPETPAGDDVTAIAGMTSGPQADLQNAFAAAQPDESGLQLAGKSASQIGIAGSADEKFILRSGEAFGTAKEHISADEGRTAGLKGHVLNQSISVQPVNESPETENEVKAWNSKNEADLETVSGSTQKPDFDETIKKNELETERFDLNEPEFRNTVQAAIASGESAAPNNTARSAETIEPYSQIRDEILSKLEKNGPTEFSMQLEPEDLGQIDIKLKLSEGKLIIDILAANTKTQTLLTGQVDRLIAGMGLQNVQVESVQVNQQMNSQTQDNGQNQAYAMNSAMDFSQRKQQEQFRQQLISNGQGGATALRQDDFSIENPVNLTGIRQYDSHRMNYTV